MGRLIWTGGAAGTAVAVGGDGLVGTNSIAGEVGVTADSGKLVGDSVMVGEDGASVGVGRGVDVARVGVGTTGVEVGEGGKVLVGVAVGNGVEVNVGLRVAVAVGTAAALSATTRPMPTCMATTRSRIGTTNQKRKSAFIIWPD